MQTRQILAFVGGIVASLASITQTAQADFSSQNSYMQVNNDGNSGTAMQFIVGSRAIPTTMSASIGVRYDEYLDGFIVDTYYQISGNWRDPNDHSYDYMIAHPMQASAARTFNYVIDDGQRYDFVSPLTVSLDGVGQIWRDIDQPNLVGSFFQANINCTGAVPMMAFTDIQEFDQSHPDWVTDWSVSMYSQWFVTTDSYPRVPAPGATALLGLGGIVAIRRRRR